jgi:formate hydrogenlyase subunit 3/multisubunit Na+/H+ antiporter MnhD subunit
MILLQAAIAAGFFLILILLLFLIIGPIILTPLLMKLYWELSRNGENIKTKKTYHEDIIPFLLSIIISIIISVSLFYLFVLFLDFLFPSFGYSN